MSKESTAADRNSIIIFSDCSRQYFKFSNMPLLQVSAFARTFFWEFCGMFRTSFRLRICERLSQCFLTTSSRLSCITFEAFFFLFEAISSVVCQKLIFENNFSKIIFLKQLSWRQKLLPWDFLIQICEELLVFWKKVDPAKIKWKKYLQNFQKFLSWMLDLLPKIFPLTSVWLRYATWVCMKSWLYSPLMSSSSPVHLFPVVLKLLWRQGCFTAEASTTLNLA